MPNKDNEFIHIMVHHDFKKKIEDERKKQGYGSLSAYARQAMREKMERDNK